MLPVRFKNRLAERDALNEDTCGKMENCVSTAWENMETPDIPSGTDALMVEPAGIGVEWRSETREPMAALF